MVTKLEGSKLNKKSIFCTLKSYLLLFLWKKRDLFTEKTHDAATYYKHRAFRTDMELSSTVNICTPSPQAWEKHKAIVMHLH